MATGQTGFAISDLPFAYSIINLGYFLLTGEFYSADHPEKFYVVALISGLIGTFLLSYHPIQKIIDDYYFSKIENYITFDVLFDDGRLFRAFRINHNFLKISFKTEAIRHEKNKIATGIYYNVFLGIIIASLFVPNFQDLIKLDYDDLIWYVLLIVTIFMFLMIFRLNKKNLIAFPYNLRRVGTYFDLMNRYGNNPKYRPDIDSIKQAIDLNDWQTVSLLLNLLLRRTNGEWQQEMSKIFATETKP